MTIVYKGIRRKTTDVLDDYGQAQYMQNVRLKRVGEMGRRAGLGKSNMAQQAGPVQFMIAGWSNAPFIINGTGGDVFGQENPLAYWTAATLRIPGGQAAQAVAPVITAVTATPLSPQPYPVGTVIFVPTVTYDGLSGPLSYLWTQQAGPAAPTPVPSIDQIWTTDFDAFCIPGTYQFSLDVTTALHGFSANFPFTYVIT